MPNVDRNDFIHAMRDVAHSVTVVTTDGPAGRHGATVSAFSSVTADPPTVLVCLNAESKIAKRVGENGRFNVNVLNADLAHVALRFAGQHDDNIQDRFDDIDMVEPDVLAGSRVFECAVSDTHLSGTHHIVLGTVSKVRGGIAAPLIYHSGMFRQLTDNNQD